MNLIFISSQKHLKDLFRTKRIILIRFKQLFCKLMRYKFHFISHTASAFLVKLDPDPGLVAKDASFNIGLFIAEED